MPAEEELPPECAAEDVEVAVGWEERDGGLRGWVVVRNTGPRACRVSGKPAVQPLDGDGEPLGVRTVITMELRRPPYAVLEPGEAARAPVSWGAWRGTTAGGRAVVQWGDPPRRTEVTVAGPAQPAATEGPTNLSSSWFTTQA